MKMRAILIVLSAVALPAAPAPAQPEAPAAAAPAAAAPVIGTKWSLKPKPKENVQGPQVPAAQRLRKPRTAAARPARRPAKARLNNQPLVAAIAKGKRNN